MPISKDDFLARRYKVREIQIPSLGDSIILRSPNMTDFTRIAPIFSRMATGGPEVAVFDLLGVQEQALIREVLANCLIEPTTTAEELADCDTEVLTALFGALGEVLIPSSEAQAAQAGEFPKN